MRKPTKTYKGNNHSFPVYGENVVFNYDAIIKARYASLVNPRVQIKATTKDQQIIMDDPYTLQEKVAFEQAWRYDPIVRLSINKKVDFIVGERPLSVLDTKKEYSGNPEAAVQAFNNVAGNQVYQEMKSWIDELHSKVKYHEKLKAAMVSMKVYGRAALHIEKFGDLCPADLKLLNSQNLGQVVVKNDSWNLYGITYNDRPNEQVTNDPTRMDEDVIYADEIIYFTNLNYNITPDTLWYGYSEVEPIIHVSECNRQIDMTDLKEINAKLWGAYGIIKFLESKDPTAMAQWLKDFKPGTWMATDANIEVDLHELKSSLKDLIEERNENDLRILRAIGIPSFLAGFESITNRACYVDTTETLTENGWKFYWDIKEGEKIATYNPQTKCIEYHVPNSFHLYPYEGKIVHFKSRTQDIMVTPDHDMWASTHRSSFKKRKASEFVNKPRVDFIASADYQEGVERSIHEIENVQYNNGCSYVQLLGIEMDSWLEFLGYYLTEGSRTYENFKDYGRHYKVEISQNVVKNKLKAEKIESCLGKLNLNGFNFTRYSHSKEKAVIWVTNNKQLHTELEKTTGGNHLTKTIPRYVFDLPKKQLQIIFDALMLGDGHQRMTNVNGYNHYIYSTTSKQLADDVQELAFKLGHTVSITNLKKANPKWNQQYQVLISRGKQVAVENITEEQYKGMVYCFDVPNHLFVTRLNGKIAIQGNTVKSILESWKVSTINPERAMLKNIIEPQWLNTLVAYYLGRKKLPAIGVKIKQEFQDIVFENVKDNVESYLPLFEQGLITGYQLLRLVGLDYLADEAKALQNKMLQQTEQLKADLSMRIDQLLGQATPSGDLKNNIEVKMLRDQLVNDIDAKIKGQVNGSMHDFVEHAIYRKMISEKVAREEV